jgi:large subunit ribosomal protein L24
MRVKRDDKVVVISGKDKGTEGKVIRSIPNSKRVVVQGVNFIKKHIKKTSQKAGERITLEAPIAVSNVMVICPSCSKPTRVKVDVSTSGKRNRACKKCSASLEQPFVKL